MQRLRAETDSLRQKLGKAQERIKSLNDAIDQKDKQVFQHYQDRVLAEESAKKALAENAIFKQENQQLTLNNTEEKEELRSMQLSAADILNRLKEKSPKSKVSLRDIETILELLES